MPENIACCKNILYTTLEELEGGKNWMNEMREKKKEINLLINKRIGKNLKFLLEQRKISQGKLCKELKMMEWGYTLDRTTINKLINEPDDSNISIPFLMECADYFHTTVDFLVSDNTEPVFQQKDDLMRKMPHIYEKSDDSYKEKSELFIDDSHSVFYRNYMNTYFCYYYSTISDENKTDNPILEGKLSLYDNNGRCSCILKVDTKKYGNDGKKFYKIYTGNAVICMASQTIHCSMCDYTIGEYCDIIFRYSQLNNAKQACRMAAVLSTSSGPDKRYPVTHRMLLSIDRILEKDYDIIKPQLCLNNSEIIVSQENLDLLKTQCVQYTDIIEEIKEMGGKQMYLLTESMIKETVKKYMPDKEEEFINKLRRYARGYRYNKVSKGVDTNLWEILHNTGYYKENNQTKI